MAMYIAASKDELNKIITGAKRNKRLFYIGVAGQHGSSAADAARHRSRGGHHADEEVGHLASEVYHTRLMRKDSVCSLEAELISKHKRNQLCVNQKRGNDRCIRAKKGIVYVRVY